MLKENCTLKGVIMHLSTREHWQVSYLNVQHPAQHGDINPHQLVYVKDEGDIDRSLPKLWLWFQKPSTSFCIHANGSHLHLFFGASSSHSLSTPPVPLLLYLFHLSDSCCVKVTVHLVEGPSLSSLTVVLWRCVNVRVFLIRLCTQTGPKAEAAPLCLKLTHSVSPFLFTLSIPSVSSPVLLCSVFSLQFFSTTSYFSLFQHNKPLYSFEDNADYVYDVMWSPVHPAMFAAVDGMGRLDLWNLNNDTEVCECWCQGCASLCSVFVCVWHPQGLFMGLSSNRTTKQPSLPRHTHTHASFKIPL